MEEHSLEITRTARIYTLGTLSEKTEHIWIVVHGYAMLAQYFIQKFDQLDPEKNFIIAPEGLSRFYQNGLQGRIGASWMTAEDRTNEIRDYVNYLEKVYQLYVAPHAGSKKLIAFGFSQGVSTLFRWMNTYSHDYYKIIAWAGSIPVDVLENYQLSEHDIQIYYGDEDPLLSIDKTEAYLSTLNQYNIRFNAILYQGGHAVTKEIVEKLV